MNTAATMGGHWFYIAMAFGITAVVIVVEIVALRARRRAAIEAAQLSGPDPDQAPSLTTASRAS